MREDVARSETNLFLTMPRAVESPPPALCLVSKEARWHFSRERFKNKKKEEKKKTLKVKVGGQTCILDLSVRPGTDDRWCEQS